jgi:flavin reductase (DIM6/NTAB) family NADH-FMN oxidoreductase RutF
MKKWNDIFSQTKVEDLQENPFKIIGEDWYLFSAGTEEDFNMMTASWGTMGVFWGKSIVTAYIRPTRHTYNYIEANDIFTLSFFGAEYRKILNFCGSKSGRDTDKITQTGLKPVLLKNSGISYEQSRLVLECKKLYFDDLKPVFFVPEDIEDHIYPNKDFHRVYYGEVIGVYIK